MERTLRRWAINRAKAVAARFGVRIVRWPSILHHDTDASAERFFPVGRHGPWNIPPDLAARTEPWARALVSVYEDRACWPSSIAPEAGMFLHALVRNLRPRIIVETGTCVGVSTIWMASAQHAAWHAARERDPSVQYPPPELHTFDLYSPPPDERLAQSKLFQDRQRGVEQRVADAALSDIVRIYQGDSSTGIRQAHELLRQAGGVQLAYIDGDHSPRGVLADFHAIEPVLAVGGYVVLHDTFPEVCNHLGPRWLMDQIKEVTTCQYQVCEVYTAQTNYGLGVLRRVL